MTNVSVLERRKNRVPKKLFKKSVVKGDLTIHNVPFIQCDSELNDFRMSGKVMFKLAEIIQHMKIHKLSEFDYENF